MVWCVTLCCNIYDLLYPTNMTETRNKSNNNTHRPTSRMWAWSIEVKIWSCATIANIISHITLESTYEGNFIPQQKYMYIYNINKLPVDLHTWTIHFIAIDEAIEKFTWSWFLRVNIQVFVCLCVRNGCARLRSRWVMTICVCIINVL